MENKYIKFLVNKETKEVTEFPASTEIFTELGVDLLYFRKFNRCLSVEEMKQEIKKIRELMEVEKQKGIAQILAGDYDIVTDEELI